MMAFAVWPFSPSNPRLECGVETGLERHILLEAHSPLLALPTSPNYPTKSSDTRSDIDDLRGRMQRTGAHLVWDLSYFPPPCWNFFVS